MKRDNLLRLRYAKNKYAKNTQLNLNFDILIILDSCRYDIFKKVYFEYLNGKLSKYYSCGCDTVSWIKNSAKNVNDPSDYFFITASPYFDKSKQKKLLGKHVFNYYPAYMYFKNKITNVVHPETLTNIAIEKISDGYIRNKKIIVWYIQPHNPFILENGSFIKDMSMFVKGEISPLEMGWLYQRNLEYALENVKILTDDLLNFDPELKIIVSSDHSEMFGEHGIYGHPYGVFYKKLQEVPFLKVNP